MQSILDAGVELIRWLSAHRSPALDVFFLTVTDVGSTLGYLVMLPVLWWRFSWRLAIRLFVALVVSVYLNALVKDAVALDRPFVSADITPLRTPDEYSFPSGHAQNATVFWGLLGFQVRKLWFGGVCALMIFLIGFSRIYLGVHFPSDVAAGIAFGAAIAWLFTKASPRIVARVTSLSMPSQLLVSMGLPAVLVVAHSTANAAAAMGAVSGALSGMVFARHRRLYPEVVPRHQRRASLLVGLVGLPGIYLATGAMGAFSDDSAWAWFHHWLRYAVIGLWVSVLVLRFVSVARIASPDGRRT
ncbi:MAG TPA: phosphatase PAP2 family protein [Vicinamibacteria bacterium]|nr:phosphatase PAP2 family protein [Vicinamibacteria bacterium]